jgi:hypothetical protein
MTPQLVSAPFLDISSLQVTSSYPFSHNVTPLAAIYKKVGGFLLPASTIHPTSFLPNPAK